ncbi:MAG TPA: MmcQ/YjbR family DNA-binding protein [Candidatus Saccharimonadales bacterium]|nr:MmcQ/YjbR family DNA-binding protein [Candidatus Saccharimonadales bacterium]
MTADQINNFLLKFDGVTTSRPFDQLKLVFSVNDQMFAILEDKQPVRLSLRCEPGLAKLLREKYEEVMPGDHLDQRHWNTLILTGQLSQTEIEDLIRHSYLQVASSPVSQTDEQ